jgi:hypothetical protein
MELAIHNVLNKLQHYHDAYPLKKLQQHRTRLDSSKNSTAELLWSFCVASSGLAARKRMVAAVT